MKKKILKASTLFMLSFIAVGCGTNEGACCEDTTKILSNIQPKGEITPIKKTLNDTPKLTPKAIVQIEKKPPVAVANADEKQDIIKTKKCKYINFDALNSYDNDGEKEDISFIWSDLNSEILSVKPTFKKRYGKKGVYENTLTAIDKDNLTSVDRICVLVDMDEEDVPLIAKISGSLKADEDEQINLTARAVCRNDYILYEWRDEDGVISLDRTLKRNFTSGKHDLTLTIEDNQGNKVTKDITIKIK